MSKLVLLIVFALLANNAWAADRKPMSHVDTDSFISETQIAPTGAGPDHLALVWWIPLEFWQATLAQDPTSSEADKQAVRDALSGVSILGIVQADMSSLGAMIFYEKDYIEENLVLNFTGPGGKTRGLRLEKTVNPDLVIVLGTLTPMLAAAMGNLGENFHFYVVNDRSPSSARLLDPYQVGLLDILITKKNGDLLMAKFEMPLDSLYIPRKCPNGKDAHISWTYCPWSGERLKD